MAGGNIPDSSIHIGLFGCTGLGKSSLLNSLRSTVNPEEEHRMAVDKILDWNLHIGIFGSLGATKSTLLNSLRFSLNHEGEHGMAGGNILDSRINIGLFGRTGVTKSSLLNSLHFSLNQEREKLEEIEKLEELIEKLANDIAGKTMGMSGVDISDSLMNIVLFGAKGAGKSSLNSLRYALKSTDKETELEERGEKLKEIREKLEEFREKLEELIEKLEELIEKLANYIAGNTMVMSGYDILDWLMNIRLFDAMGAGKSYLIKSLRYALKSTDEEEKGLEDLRKKLTSYSPGKSTGMAGVDIPDSSIHIGLFGHTVAGKSSLINSLRYDLKRFSATAMVQVRAEQTDTQNTEEEEKEEEEEDNINIAMESLPHETDEVNVKPIQLECCKRVGVQGGRLKLDSFGIELEIPPGAIDSEAPMDISLRVLTDTRNLGNSKEEMSVCFGVQCSAPDDLVLKLPVTYTIPHCAVLTSYSSVEAVLYTGEGEYSPDAVVKERSMVSQSGIPSWTITKDVLKLKMNHFSWGIMRLIQNVFFREKRMCCRPFKEKILALQRKPVILHAHLYDDIKGNSEMIKRQEEEQEFVPAYPEQPVLIQAGKGDLKMTCHVKETVIGGPVVIPYDQLMSGARICEPFQLDFTNQPDIVAVSLKVGQIERLQVHLLFPLDFSTPHKTEGASSQDSDEVIGAKARVQVHKEQTDTQNNEEEDMEEEEEEEEEEYYVAMESPPRETDELVGATSRVQAPGGQTDTKNTGRRRGGGRRKGGRRRGLRSHGKPAP